MTTERINQLFLKGEITLDEHEELIGLYSVFPEKESKGNSGYSHATLIMAIITFFLMFTITINNKKFALLADGNQRMLAGVLFSALTIGLFVSARKLRRTENYKDNYAYIGLGIVLSLLLIIVPVAIMWLFSR